MSAKQVMLLCVVALGLIAGGVALYRVDDWNAVWVNYVRKTTGAKIGRPDKAGGKQINVWKEPDDPGLGAEVVKNLKQRTDEVQGTKKGQRRKPDFKAAREEAKRAYEQEVDFSVKEK